VFREATGGCRPPQPPIFLIADSLFLVLIHRRMWPIGELRACDTQLPTVGPSSRSTACMTSPPRLLRCPARHRLGNPAPVSVVTGRSWSHRSGCRVWLSSDARSRVRAPLLVLTTLGVRAASPGDDGLGAVLLQGQRLGVPGGAFRRVRPHRPPRPVMRAGRPHRFRPQRGVVVGVATPPRGEGVDDLPVGETRPRASGSVRPGRSGPWSPASPR